MTQTMITAKDVAELRARTGAGMMDCKRALEEAGGDQARATEILRARGIAKADKRAGRQTSQGLIAGVTTDDGRGGALLELTCETDFVARTADFEAVAEALVRQLAASAPVTLEEFLAAPAPGDAGRTVADLVKEVSGKTGETVVLRNVARFAAGEGAAVGLYLHHNRQVGVLVEAMAAPAAAAGQAPVRDLLRELAIHIASASPLAVRGEEIPAEVLERERRIGREQAAEEGKPEAIRDKIVEGKVRKFMAENALLEQPWVKDPQRPVRQLVAEAGRAAGAEVTVTRFVRLRVGEG